MSAASAVGRPLDGSLRSKRYWLQTKEKAGRGLKAGKRSAIASESVSEPCRGQRGAQAHRVKEGCGEQGGSGSVVRSQVGSELALGFGARTEPARSENIQLHLNYLF